MHNDWSRYKEDEHRLGMLETRHTLHHDAQNTKNLDWVHPRRWLKKAHIRVINLLDHPTCCFMHIFTSYWSPINSTLSVSLSMSSGSARDGSRNSSIKVDSSNTIDSSINIESSITVDSAISVILEARDSPCKERDFFNAFEAFLRALSSLDKICRRYVLLPSDVKFGGLFSALDPLLSQLETLFGHLGFPNLSSSVISRKLLRMGNTVDNRFLSDFRSLFPNTSSRILASVAHCQKFPSLP